MLHYLESDLCLTRKQTFSTSSLNTRLRIQALFFVYIKKNTKKKQFYYTTSCVLHCAVFFSVVNFVVQFRDVFRTMSNT